MTAPRVESWESQGQMMEGWVLEVWESVVV